MIHEIKYRDFLRFLKTRNAKTTITITITAAIAQSQLLSGDIMLVSVAPPIANNGSVVLVTVAVKVLATVSTTTGNRM
jgi:hypothetical protein